MVDAHYFEIDYDADSVTEYERQGECNGCGECCIAVIKFMVAGELQKRQGWDSRNGGETTDGKGKWQGVWINNRWRFFKLMSVENDPAHRCPMLSQDNRCRIHAGKNLLSREWPMAPTQVEPFKNCSYSFREVRRATIEEFWND